MLVGRCGRPTLTKAVPVLGEVWQRSTVLFLPFIGTDELVYFAQLRREEHALPRLLLHHPRNEKPYRAESTRIQHINLFCILAVPHVDLLHDLVYLGEGDPRHSHVVQVQDDLQLLALVGDHPVPLADVEYQVDAVVEEVVGEVDDVGSDVHHRLEVAAVTESVDEALLQILLSSVVEARDVRVTQKFVG